MEQRFKVGVITSPHGVRGEVKVYPVTEDVQRFKSLKEVLLVQRGVEQTRRIKGVKFFKNMVILKIEGIESMDEAEQYRQCELFVSRENAIPLNENEYYVADLVGMRVDTESEVGFGEIRDVIKTGANDVYVIDTPAHGEVLVPAIKQCILKVDPEQNQMLIRLLPGLVD